MLSDGALVAAGNFSRRRNLLVFLLPSLLGLFLFLTPIAYQGNTTIAIAALASELRNALGSAMPSLLFSVMLLSGLLTLLCKLINLSGIQHYPALKNLLMPAWPWVILRVMGAGLAAMVFLELGPEALRAGATGSLMFQDLMPVLLSVFVFAGVFLPLLLNFGLLEFLSYLLTPIMRPLFNLPGRSAIDCGASWLGDGTVGIMMTNQQYEQGFYTQREAAVISTTFSLVSISFSLVVIAEVKLEHLFVPFYLTVSVACILAAMITPRLPPLSLKRDRLLDGTVPCPKREQVPDGHSLCAYGFEQALGKADQIANPLCVVGDGFKNAADTIFGLLPVVMAVGTLALVVAEYTPLFDWLGKPFVPFLELLGVPEAVAASKTIMTGFADMFLPAILIASVESDMTRFVIAALSVTQLIYLSEVGALLLGTRIPINFIELLAIFLLRTLITLPIIAGAAHLIF